MTYDPYVTPVDHILLAGQKSPGIAVVSGAADVRKWDVRAGYGLSGGVTVFRGRELSKFTVTLKLVTAQDWTDWDAFKPLVARPPFGTKPKSMSIWHPWLAALDISSVGVEEVGQPEEDGDTGAYSIAIKFLETREPKFALAKPEAAATSPKSQDPYDQKIEQLTEEFRNEARK
jgi:hypothetical protein